ncbi:hypothetical protein EK21DRAFT_91623 [Setomelanomma holmii]|uniref:BYS1 domain protein n=1 Tax=Setomelanomma holmii TaxID=210430 RepID=A0A9P4LKT0_9PLEO|nr:hypothetical protein EK21DRAFT_91623 [Setomelanomma holmii]
MRFLLLCLAASTTSASAVGNALVLNSSNSTIYAWSVGSDVSPRQTIGPGGGLWYEPLHQDEKTGGIAIKITEGPEGLYNGEPQQVFSYNLDGDKVWYDLSSVFGAPFAGLRVEVTSTSGEPIVWPAGVHPGGSQAKVTKSDENIWFTVYSR